jgi:hypothetical protein
VSAYAIDDGARLILIDPIAVPDEVRALFGSREVVTVLTSTWHERDAGSLGFPVWAPAPDRPEDQLVPATRYAIGDSLFGMEASRCAACGYGASCRIAPDRCPMCGGHAWEHKAPRSAHEVAADRGHSHGRCVGAGRSLSSRKDGSAQRSNGSAAAPTYKQHLPMAEMKQQG